MQLTMENVHKFWEKSSKFPVLFNAEIRGNFTKFLELFFTQYSEAVIVPNGLFWYVDDFVGVFYMTNIVPGFDAKVHFTFFDGRFSGRLELTKQMIEYVFKRYQFIRLSAEIPAYVNEKVVNFIEFVGFSYEGRKRDAVEYKGDMFDVKLFGILKGEVEKWDTNKKKLEEEPQSV